MRKPIPTFDVEGQDTAHKLAILTSLAYGTQVAADEIYVEGISNISLSDIHAARELGYRIKLLGVAQKTATGIEQRVHPTMVPLSSMIGQVDRVTNAVGIEADTVGSLLLSGPGAGGDATASAVIGDVADIAKSLPGHQEAPVFGRPANELETYKRAEISSHEGGYFIRMTVHDRIGVFASLAGHMAENGISLESIVQHGGVERATDEPKTVILVTHETTEAISAPQSTRSMNDGHLVSKPQVIRIEPAG
jgi:homoserine dehydrogenase